MPKTKEEILADITKAVEGQGNQGAIAIAPILKDIVKLAGEGGGGGSTTNVIRASSTDGVNYIIDNPDDLEMFAEKAERGECVILKLSVPDPHSDTVEAYAPVKYLKSSNISLFTFSETTASSTNVITTLCTIYVDSKSMTLVTDTYPA